MKKSLDLKLEVSYGQVNLEARILSKIGLNTHFLCPKERLWIFTYSGEVDALTGSYFSRAAHENF